MHVIVEFSDVALSIGFEASILPGEKKFAMAMTTFGAVGFGWSKSVHLSWQNHVDLFGVLLCQICLLRVFGVFVFCISLLCWSAVSVRGAACLWRSTATWQIIE